MEIEFHPSTSIKDGQEKVAKIQQYIEKQKGICQVNTYYGTDMPKIFGMSTSSSVGAAGAQMLIFVDKEQVSARKTRDRLSQCLKQAFPQECFSLSVVESGPPVGAPLAIRIEGDSLEQLQGATDELRQLFLSSAGILSVQDDIGQTIPRIILQPVQAAMLYHNVHSWQISQSLSLYGGGIKLGEINDGQDLIKLRLKYNQQLQSMSQDGQQARVFNDENDTVPLSSVTRATTDLDLPGISHHNYQRSNTIRAYLDSGSDPDIILESIYPKINKILAKYPQLRLAIEGEMTARNEVFLEMGKIFLLVLLLILIVITVQFNSLVLAGVILTTVVLSSSGALYTLFITRTPLGFMSLMGVISLAGIVVRNGIILIEFMEERIKGGIRLEEAIHESCSQRLRPVLLTTGTTFFSLVPLVFGSNLMFKPLAICISGGLLYCTLLTLIIVPSFYYLWKKHQLMSSSMSSQS